MSYEWSPGEGDRVYVDADRQSGRIIACDIDGSLDIYIVELDAAPGAIAGQQSQRWGYVEPEVRRCSIEELTPA